MSKTYKGYELIKAIAEGNIKEGAKFIEYKDNKEVTRSTFNGKDFEHITDRYSNYDTAWHLFNCTFELIEDEIDIQSIEEIDIDQVIEKDDKIGIALLHINKLIKVAKQLDNKIKEVQV